jgi:hypothetical protein
MPLTKNIHIDRALTNVSQKISNADNFVATAVWPIVPVAKDSDKFFKYDNAHLRLDDDEWAERAVANEVDWDVIQDAYATERKALQQLITNRERRNADSPLSVETDTVESLSERLMIRREDRLKTILIDFTNNFDSDARPILAAGKKWDDVTSAASDPNRDIREARQTIRKKIFRAPNIIILSNDAFEAAREHPKVLDRIKFTQRGVVSADILASLWDVERVLVAGAGKNSGTEGAADSLGFIWPDNVWVGWVTRRASLRTPSWGYHFQSQDMLVERWRDDERKGDVFRNSFEEIAKLVTKSAGFVHRNVIS